MSIASSDEEALYNLAIRQAEEGNFASSVSLLQELIRINCNNDPRIRLALANVYTLMGAASESRATLIQLINEYPDYAPGYHNLGVAYYREKNWQLAINAFQAAIERAASYVDAYYHLGLVYFTLQRFKEAFGFFSAVLHFDSTHVGARFYQACVHLQQGQVDAAYTLLLRLHDDHPLHFETLVNLSHCYLAKSDIKNARITLEKAHVLAPEDTQVLFNLGVIAYYQARFAEAISFYESVLNLAYTDVAARYNLALLYLNLNKTVEAKAQLQILAGIAPQFEQGVYLLQALEGNRNVTEAPASFLSMLFDEYALHYDAHMVALNYAVPQKIYHLFQQYVAKFSPLSLVIDLGAGTGQLGALLKPYVRDLIAVDLSQRMLDIACKKMIYTTLHQVEVVHFLEYEVLPGSVDCLVAADCLVYLGNLAPLMQIVKKALKPGGFFIFNIESQINGDYFLQMTGRFSHAGKYIDALLSDQLFVLHQEEIVLRYQNNLPVRGYVYLVQKKGDSRGA